jgi:hypothetical protein
MRRPLLLLPLLLCAATLRAREIVDGYYLTLKNDTVRCKIEPRELEIFDKVTIIDSTEKYITYKAKDPNGINGFGFIYKDRKYDYVVKVNEDNEWHFLIVIETGSRLNLYYSFHFVYTGKGGVIKADRYTLEDSAKNVISAESGILTAYKRRIREFLKDDPKLVDLFNKHVSKLDDIPEFVRMANSSVGS